MLMILAFVAGCGGSKTSGPSSSAPNSSHSSSRRPGLVVDITISGGNVTPTNAEFKAKVGQPIRLRVNSDAADELHVHSVPDHTFQVEAKPNQIVPVHRRRTRPGRGGAAQAGPHGGHHPSSAVTSEQQTVLAHGLGGSTDLPVPLGYALVGAAWALTFTFAVVALAWRKPRFDPAKPGLPLP